MSELKGLERLFFDIRSPSTPIFAGKKHSLLVIEYSSNYTSSIFLKEKSELADIMLCLIKTFKNKYNMQIQYLCCDYAGENVVFEKACKWEGLAMDFEYNAPGKT